MGDPQWRAKQTQSESGGMSIDMEQGNLVCAFLRDDTAQSTVGQLSLVSSSDGAPIEINEGANSCEADAAGVALACYPPETKEITAVVACSMGRYEFPMTIEEEEVGMCLIGRVNTAPAPPKPEENPVPKREEADATVLVLQADEDADGGEGSFQTTADALGQFIVKQRTNIPGALQDLNSVAAQLREFGFNSFIVKTYKTKQFPNGRKYLIFKGNPRNPGSFIARRELIRSFGRYTFQNPKVVQLGIGTKAALKAGARATVISFIVVAALDVTLELLDDDPSLTALGVTIAVDATKLAISGLAGALAAGGVVALVGGAPVIVVAGAALLVGLAVGLALDKIDDAFGITQALRKHAKELEQEVDNAVGTFLFQLEWCIMHPYRCFGF